MAKRFLRGLSINAPDKSILVQAPAPHNPIDDRNSRLLGGAKLGDVVTIMHGGQTAKAQIFSTSTNIVAAIIYDHSIAMPPGCANVFFWPKGNTYNTVWAATFASD